MTATITDSITAIVQAASFGALTSTYGLTAILLFLLLLIGKEMSRIRDGAPSRRRLQVFNVALLPLLLTSGLVVLVRFLRLAGLL